MKKQIKELTITSGTARSNLFEALDVPTGQVAGQCYPRCGSVEFVAFIKTVAAQYIDRKVHVVVDNLGTHFIPEVRNWLTIRTSPFITSPSECRGSTISRSGLD
ncbi:MAG: transposase [Pseudonocardiaceae bacterium]